MDLGPELSLTLYLYPFSGNDASDASSRRDSLVFVFYSYKHTYSKLQARPSWCRSATVPLRRRRNARAHLKQAVHSAHPCVHASLASRTLFSLRREIILWPCGTCSDSILIWYVKACCFVHSFLIPLRCVRRRMKLRGMHHIMTVQQCVAEVMD